MKNIVLISALMLCHVASFACEVCQKQQPKALRGITHGAGPQSDWDYVVVWATVLIVLVSLFYSIKWIIDPGEKERKHIKNIILYFD